MNKDVVSFSTIGESLRNLEKPYKIILNQDGFITH